MQSLREKWVTLISEAGNSESTASGVRQNLAKFFLHDLRFKIKNTIKLLQYIENYCKIVIFSAFYTDISKIVGDMSPPSEKNKGQNPPLFPPHCTPAKENVYTAIIMQSDCKSSPGSWDECRTLQKKRKKQPSTFGPRQLAMTRSTNVHTSYPLTTISQPKCLHSLCRPTEGRRLSDLGTEICQNTSTKLTNVFSRFDATHSTRPRIVLVHYEIRIASPDISALLKLDNLHIRV